MSVEDETAVWNRACEVLAGADDSTVREGDRALMAAIALDGAVQSGGLGSALEQDLTGPGAEGLRWFGLQDIADVVVRVERRLAQAPPGDTAALEETEATDDPAYYGLEVEARLAAALASQLEAAPEAFAPLS